VRRPRFGAGEQIDRNPLRLPLFGHTNGCCRSRISKKTGGPRRGFRISLVEPRTRADSRAAIGSMTRFSSSSKLCFGGRRSTEGAPPSGAGWRLRRSRFSLPCKRSPLVGRAKRQSPLPSLQTAARAGQTGMARHPRRSARRTATPRARRFLRTPPREGDRRFAERRRRKPVPRRIPALGQTRRASSKGATLSGSRTYFAKPLPFLRFSESFALSHFRAIAFRKNAF
jgi:hypothetical protein